MIFENVYFAYVNANLNDLDLISSIMLYTPVSPIVFCVYNIDQRNPLCCIQISKMCSVLHRSLRSRDTLLITG